MHSTNICGSAKTAGLNEAFRKEGAWISMVTNLL